MGVIYFKDSYSEIHGNFEHRSSYVEGTSVPELIVWIKIYTGFRIMC